MSQDDKLAFDALSWAFSGSRAMAPEQHREVRSAILQAKVYAAPTRRRRRIYGLGPVWARMVKSGEET